ncbi:MAG: N-acetylmuramic acid 6-phosphate etherase [Bacteroidetes bacterium]|jgi:N-acetylmuramic acid 6-phosphate etherase|nr:N-acetylmuramic acid 6-phosphate etherase [Bacteroidota bacterium]
MEKITEKPSAHRHLEKKSIGQLISAMNTEDQLVALSVKQSLPQIEQLTQMAYGQLQAGGRLIYLGAGTSGRLGIVDASECPPTFGVGHDRVLAIIAGGDAAIRRAQEFAEDDPRQGWLDLEALRVSPSDAVVGLSASGTTPYVLGALKECRAHRIPTGSICCNPNSPISAYADYPVEVVVGPELLTGSTRLKSGTAQKMVLNMISTASMIKLGHVRDNKMVDMALNNNKLIERGVQMLVGLYALSPDEARTKLREHGSVRAVIAILEP